MKATGELNDAITSFRQRNKSDGSWRVMRRFFTNRSDGSSGILNFAAAWFMQGKEVSNVAQWLAQISLMSQSIGAIGWPLYYTGP